jgi:hypothetical protein
MDDECDMDDILAHQMIHIMAQNPARAVEVAGSYVHVTAQLLIFAREVVCNIIPNALYTIVDMFRVAF